MDKKHMFIGLLSTFVVLAGIYIILNPNISSDAKVSQDLYISSLADCCSGLDNNSTNSSNEVNTSTCEVKTLRNETC